MGLYLPFLSISGRTAQCTVYNSFSVGPVRVYTCSARVCNFRTECYVRLVYVLCKCNSHCHFQNKRTKVIKVTM